MTVNTIIAYAKILANGEKPFYASEFHFYGGTMGDLQSHGLVKKTGNYKEIMVEIDENLYKKCKVYEWIGIRKNYMYNTILREYVKAKELVAACCDILIADDIF